MLKTVGKIVMSIVEQKKYKNGRKGWCVRDHRGIGEWKGPQGDQWMVLIGGVLLALYSIPREMRFYPLQTFRSTVGLKIN